VHIAYLKGRSGDTSIPVIAPIHAHAEHLEVAAQKVEQCHAPDSLLGHCRHSPIRDAQWWCLQQAVDPPHHRPLRPTCVCVKDRALQEDTLAHIQDRSNTQMRCVVERRGMPEHGTLHKSLHAVKCASLSRRRARGGLTRTSAHPGDTKASKVPLKTAAQTGRKGLWALCASVCFSCSTLITSTQHR
jgi:hypothetical protein